MHKTSSNLWFAGLCLTLIFAAIGELFRFHGFLLLDYWMPLFGGAWLLNSARKSTLWNLIRDTRAQWGFLFVVVGLASLAVHAETLSDIEFLKAALYGFRFLALFLLMFITEDLDATDAHRLRYALALFFAFLAGAGFVQLYFVPDFTPFESLGWDPHQNRLLSTWFDPNFVGGALAFALPWFLEGIWRKSEKKRVLIIGLCVILAVAILLTYSRSAYLAALVGVGLWTLRRSWKLALSGTLLIALFLGVSPRAQERVLGLIQGIESITHESYVLADPSARLRFASWEEGWQLFLDSPFIGQGVNRYSDAALKQGTMTDPGSHSATGSDSSLLNVLALTGLLGALCYIMLFYEILKKNHFFAFSLSGILVHSVFVNSLFFSLFLVPFWILAAKTTRVTFESPKPDR